MIETLIIYTPELPRGYGAFDQWEDDYCETCHKPYDECTCDEIIDEDET